MGLAEKSSPSQEPGPKLSEGRGGDPRPDLSRAPLIAGNSSSHSKGGNQGFQLCRAGVLDDDVNSSFIAPISSLSFSALLTAATLLVAATVLDVGSSSHTHLRMKACQRWLRAARGELFLFTVTDL